MRIAKKISDHLYALHRKGTINMFEAPKMLEQKFGVTKKEAWRIFSFWVETFDYGKGRVAR